MKIKANKLACNLMKQVNNGIPLGINHNILINKHWEAKKLHVKIIYNAVN